MALFQKQDSCFSSKAATACGCPAESLRLPTRLRSRGGRSAEINVRFAPPIMCRLTPYQVIQFYRNRGRMENFIKEGKSGFDFAAVSSHSKVVNANRMRLHMLAYNLFNWFRRLTLPANMRKQQVDTIRLKLIKIAARAVRSAGSITFKLCSSCPYKKEFYKTLENIRQLTVQLE